MDRIVRLNQPSLDVLYSWRLTGILSDIVREQAAKQLSNFATAYVHQEVPSSVTYFVGNVVNFTPQHAYRLLKSLDFGVIHGALKTGKICMSRYLRRVV